MQRIYMKIHGANFRDSFFHIWLRNFYDRPSGRVNRANLFHLGIRSCNFFALSFLMIIASHYATLAHVNFGIIASCLCISTPLNCILMYFLFKEKLTPRHIIGTLIILVGVIFVSLSKGQVHSQILPDSTTQNDRDAFKLISVSLALLTGCLSSTRTLQAKFVSKRYEYSPMDFSIDGGLFCGIVLGVMAMGYWVSGNQGYTWHNFWVTFVSSTLQMITSVIALNAQVKGLAGPTSAIISTNSIIQTILNAIFLAVYPSYMQIIASGIAISGVIIMVLPK
ncbi:hypothetical protein FGO68_gene10634 [Halteria grandinella]|uniref:EamA domain-containing protein n=1 Tax=Halteria grandinella TaxID=5974 RepID=A0A8J8T0X6_HALGN|nr:hypothetical protein FGO68_gene10634 [Halteria grandinella]